MLLRLQQRYLLVLTAQTSWEQVSVYVPPVPVRFVLLLDDTDELLVHSYAHETLDSANPLYGEVPLSAKWFSALFLNTVYLTLFITQDIAK